MQNVNGLIQTPAQKLLGVILPCGWKVVEFIAKNPNQTGGNFSVGYIVEKDGVRAFLKALDFKKLMSARNIGDPVKAILNMTESFDYERNILRQCRENKMNRVIRSLSEGTYQTDDDISVPYIIFEMADGDIRKHTLETRGFDIAWSLRTMHHVLVGLKQLHSRDISHQDIKPSNILLVDGKTRKIGDFGTSVTRDCTLPHAEYRIAGDKNYAPLEAWYGYINPDWSIRRLGNDMYQAGSLLIFMLIDVPLTVQLFEILDEQYHPNQWQGTYDDVLPYIQEAYSGLIDRVHESLNVEYGDEIVQILREICNPSLLERGDPVARRNSQNPFALERYISRLDRLAKKAELQFRVSI